MARVLRRSSDVRLYSRELPRSAGADVTFLRGDVREALPPIIAAAGLKDVWVVGGGDLAGQFLDAHVLDKIAVSVAPVTPEIGVPLLPRRLESDHLTLMSVTQQAQFIYATYGVTYPRPESRARGAHGGLGQCLKRARSAGLRSGDLVGVHGKLDE